MDMGGDPGQAQEAPLCNGLTFRWPDYFTEKEGSVWIGRGC